MQVGENSFSWAAMGKLVHIFIYVEHKIVLLGTGVPNVVGAVDGTLVTIRKPYVNPKDYISRHNKPQLNVMVKFY